VDGDDDKVDKKRKNRTHESREIQRTVQQKNQSHKSQNLFEETKLHVPLNSIQHLNKNPKQLSQSINQSINQSDTMDKWSDICQRK
jgi:hypothetical protein